MHTNDSNRSKVERAVPYTFMGVADKQRLAAHRDGGLHPSSLCYWRQLAFTSG